MQETAHGYANGLDPPSLSSMSAYVIFLSSLAVAHDDLERSDPAARPSTVSTTSLNGAGFGKSGCGVIVPSTPGLSNLRCSCPNTTDRQRYPTEGECKRASFV